MLVQQRGIDLRIAINAFVFFVAFRLYVSCLHDTVTYLCTVFCRAGGGEFAKWNGCYFYMQIDAVEQWPADFIEVFLHGSRRATAFFFGVVVVAARAGVHAGHQHKRSRKIQRHFCPANGHSSFFHRLPHYFQSGAFELGQFVQKQHAVVGQRYFARLRVATTAHQGCITHRVVRTAKWSFANQCGIFWKLARHAVNFGGFQSFLQREWR